MRRNKKDWTLLLVQSVNYYFMCRNAISKWRGTPVCLVPGLCICSARRLALLKTLLYTKTTQKNFNVPLFSTKCADPRFHIKQMRHVSPFVILCATFSPEKWKSNDHENLKTCHDGHVGISMCTLFKLPTHTWTVTRNAIPLRKVWNV